MSLADYAANLRALDGIGLRAGWTDPAVAKIARINEEGDELRKGRPPARPVLLPVADEHGDEILSGVGGAVAAGARALPGLAVAVAADRLEQVGAEVEAMILDKIDSVMPENAPSTIRKKGVDAPLRGGPKPQAQDRLWKGVTHEIVRP